MKTIKAFILVFVSSIVISCNLSNNPEPDKIVGIWQNVDNPLTQIEFTKDGEYFLLVNEERITESLSLQDSSLVQSMDSTVKGSDIVSSSITKYTYDPTSSGMNLKITTDKDVIINQGEIEFINEDMLNLSLFDNDKPISETQFKRIKK